MPWEAPAITKELRPIVGAVKGDGWVMSAVQLTIRVLKMVLQRNDELRITHHASTGTYIVHQDIILAIVSARSSILPKGTDEVRFDEELGSWPPGDLDAAAEFIIYHEPPWRARAFVDELCKILGPRRPHHYVAGIVRHVILTLQQLALANHGLSIEESIPRGHYVLHKTLAAMCKISLDK